MKTKVVLGMSGGVDSSVSAYLLQKEGYEVIGVTLKFLNDTDTSDAKRICDKLSIEHHVIDYTKEFNELVIKDFINKYKQGITPNPCVTCNKNAKLYFLYKAMIDYKCDFFATGHYVRHINNIIARSSDIKKDQSYFLSCVDSNILKHILFPLDNLTKEDVRKIANEIKLDNANKKDSYDICFIKDDFKIFINSNLEMKRGDIIDVETNKKVGTHNGIANYTIGQRKNVGLSGNEKRHYVCGKDTKNNILYVAFGDDSKYLLSDEALIEDMNYISLKHPTFATVKFRYKSDDVPVCIEYIDEKHIRVKYNDVKAVTPGQTCAIYLGEQCIGGGTIKQVFKNNKEIWYLK